MSNGEELYYLKPLYCLKLLDDFKKWMVLNEEKYSPNTRTDYFNYSRTVLNYFIEQNYILTDFFWNKYIDYCINYTPFKSSKVNNENAALKSFGKFLVDEDKNVTENPFEKFNRLPRDDPEPAVMLNIEEIRKFLNIVDHKRREDKLLVKLLYVTSCSRYLKEFEKISYGGIDRNNATTVIL